MTPIAPASCMDFDRIDALLAAWQWLWQPAPFTATPAWQSRCPALYQTLANLSESDYLALLQNESRCLDWLCEFLPELAELRPFQDHAVPLTTSAREQSRKQRQVQAFADAVQPGGRRVIEWCAGQGWLLEELPRRQFRRLLEWWLVLDMAWYLAEQGYRTRVQVFCATPLTPRNLLLEARRD